MKCHSLKQYLIAMASIAGVLLFLFLFNGCSITTTTAAPAPLPTINTYSNINTNKNISNFDLHIFTNEEEALIVPCYYWKMVDSAKN